MATINLRGLLVDILLNISSEYKAYVTREKGGVNNLLLRCQNSQYGTMVASLLYYNKLTKSITIIGFDIDQYDMCIANKVIKGSQMTI